MTAYWVKFEGRSPACVEASSHEEAMRIGSEHGGAKAISAVSLPYPALPRLGPKGDCPSFCYRPEQCAGRSCCPQDYSCTE